MDDYLIIAAAGDPSGCREDLRRLVKVFDWLHIPVAIEKLEGPWSMDPDCSGHRTEHRHLPAEKLSELRSVVARMGRRFCTPKELELLVGKLQHACKVVRPGWTFMRRMFERGDPETTLCQIEQGIQT